jgi:oligopeptide transport system substrate-binding protein
LEEDVFMKKRFIAMACFILILAAAGTASAAPGGKKTLNYSNGAAPPVLEPIMNNYLDGSYIMYNIFCGLARIGQNGIPELAYAESYEVSDDGLTYTFKIREGAKFSDGSPLTARDWEESFKHRISPEVASPGVNLYLYVKNAEAYNQGKGGRDEVGISAVDDRTLRITFENPTPFFMDLICYYIPYKMDVVKSNPGWFKNPETYIGNGAFRVVKIDAQTGLALEKNPNYYDAANVKLDAVNYNFIDDGAVALEAYRNGELDVNDNLSPDAIKAYSGSPEMVTYPVIGTRYLSIHTGNVKDARVRRALSLALDMKVIVGKILGQPYIPAEGIVPYGIHWGGREFREVAGNLVEFNVNKAKSLLEEAGYPGGKGLPPIRMITQNTQEFTDAAQAYQAMWKAIGVETNISTYEASVYWDLIPTEGWDVASDGWTGDYDDPKTSLYLWMAYKQGPDKDVRWYDTDNARKFEALMREADKELEGERRLNLFKEAEATLLADMPVIPLWHRKDPALIKPYVTGIVKSNIGHVYFCFADVADH